MNLQREVIAQGDKLDKEYDLLERMLEFDGAASSEQVRILVTQVKRVRRESSILLRNLAKWRDHLQAKELQGNE